MIEQLHRLGALLHQRRVELRKSVRQVARAAGISHVYLRVLERGENPKTGRPSRPSLEVLLALAAELQLDPPRILDLAGYQPILQAQTPSLPDEQQDLVRANPDFHRLAQRLDTIEAVGSGAGDPDGLSLGVRPGDHLLFFVDADASTYRQVLLSSVREVLSDHRRRDACVIRLEPNHSAASVMDGLVGLDTSRLLVVEPDEAWASYARDPQGGGVLIETPASDLEAHAADAAKISATHPDAVHVMTEDCSAFAAAIADPDNLIQVVEPSWLETEQGVYSPLPVGVVCMYKYDDLATMPASNLSFAERVIALLTAHNRVAVLRDQHLLHGGEAASDLLNLAAQSGVTEDLLPQMLQAALAHRAPVGHWTRAGLRPLGLVS
jgi:transcriptional regulator with XRE-family HTH domain